MKSLVAVAGTLSLVCGCGGPDVGSSAESLEAHRTLARPQLRAVEIDRDRIQRLDIERFGFTSQQACTPDAPPAATSHTMNLWPPNHTLHAISAADCVTITDDCDTDLTAELVWASSDEPANDLGDGNHEPDIVAGCPGVQLRAERQGPQNGRVYHIGWRVEDSGGNVVEGSCTVIVDHDQRGVIGEDDGEAYRVDLDPSSCGEPEPEPPEAPECPDYENPDCL